MKDMKLIVKCLICGEKKTLRGSDGPYGVQMCQKDGGVMVPVKAKSQ